MVEAYIEQITALRETAEARALEAYVAATNKQILDAADLYERTGSVQVRSEEFTRTVRDIYSDTFMSSSRWVYNHLTSRKVDMDEETRRRVIVILINFFFASLLALVQQMQRTTRIDIFAIVQKGIEQGKDNKEIARDIRRMAPSLARQRAVARATTTVTHASEMGMAAGAKEAGVLKKTWVTTLDERTRRGERGYDHASAHLQTVPFSDAFFVSGEFLNHPGDTTLGAGAGNVVNCRCVTFYSV